MDMTWVCGSDGAGGTHCRETQMATLLGLSPVRIESPNDDEDDGGRDQRSPAIGWLKNGWKRGRIIMGTAAIAATTMVMGGLEMKISMNIIYMGGRIGQRWLIGARKQPKRRRQWQKPNAKSSSVAMTVVALVVVGGTN